MRRTKGSGSLRLRGTIWWMEIGSGPGRVRESCQTGNRDEAEALLAVRISELESAAPVVQPVTIDVIARSSMGTASELLVCADLLSRGYQVFRAVCQHAPCDLIAMGDDKLYRVEVKTGRGGAVSIRTKNRGRFDVLAVVPRVFRPSSIKYTPDLPAIHKYTPGYPTVSEVTE